MSEDSSTESDHELISRDARPAKRQKAAHRPRPTVYSSVAGHETRRPRQILPATVVSAKPSAPADVLIERLSAPERYAEPQLDWYDAHRFLESKATRRSDVYDHETLEKQTYHTHSNARDEVGGRESHLPDLELRNDPEVEKIAERKDRARLPDSDLCKAVHRYSSGFYSLLQHGTSQPESEDTDTVLTSFRSFDESALLAFGILLEESAANLVKSGSGMSGEGWRTLAVGLDKKSRELPPLRLRRPLKTIKRESSEEADAVSREPFSEALRSKPSGPTNHDVKKKIADKTVAYESGSDGQWRGRFDADDY